MQESAQEISLQVRSGKLTRQEVFERSVSRIKTLNPLVNAIIDFDEEAAKESKALNGEKLDGSLAGVPVAFKDNICVKGKMVSAGSKILRDYRSPFDSTIAAKLFSSGARYIGRCNLDEFAMGSTSETSFFGPVKNPWDLTRSAGGSSGGSAVAVACGMVPIAIGTDTGGSIRLPATHCGIIGLKPTYGSLSRYGLIAYGSSLDQAGPMARTVSDIALAYGAMVGLDSKDSTSVEAKGISAKTTSTIGRFPALEKGIVDGAIRDSLDKASASLEEHGNKVVNLELGMTSEEVMAIYYIIAVSEASSNLARFDGLRYGFPPEHRSENLEDYYKLARGNGFGFEVKARIMMGAYCLSEGHYDDWFVRAAKLRRLLKNEFDQHLRNVDGFLLPVCSSAAPMLGEFSKDPTDMYRQDAFTAIANLTGYPSLSLPISFNKDGLPVGVQLMSSNFSEPALFAWGTLLENENQVLKQKPPLIGKSNGQ